MSVAGNPLYKLDATVPSSSSSLRRELGIADLVLAQILVIIVPEFFGTAVRAGASHVVLWILAIVLFFIPHALVVARLNRLLPLEGGLYEWARFGFGDRIGFLVAWNVWLLQTIQVSQIALVTTTYVSYAAPRVAWIANSQPMLIATSVGLIAAMTLFARFGLRVGKLWSNIGSVFTIFTLTILIVLPYFVAWRGRLPSYHPLPLLLPPLTLFSLSVFSKMTFGALSGFETVAIFAGESRNPARNIAKSILITAPVIALLYILGTSAILEFVSPDRIDVIGPIPQALARGFAMLSIPGSLAPIVILLLLLNYLCSYPLYFAANSRLPMVAGWDHLLPRWFTPLHPKYHTPINSILFMAGVALVASLAVLIGVGSQESFALLQTWGWTCYGLAYLAMFAIPLFSAKGKGLRPAYWLRIGSASGFLITLLFVALSVVPSIDVASVWKYSSKIIVVVLAANCFGWMIYHAGQRKIPVRTDRMVS
jgi:glutamate:GABA antiporter